MEPPNIVHHIADLIASHVEKTQDFKAIHRIEFVQPFYDNEPASPQFTLDRTGCIIEYPLGVVRTDHVFDWFSRRKNTKGEIIQNMSHPDGCRVHNNIQAFADSVFNRIYMDWNSFIDDDNDYGVNLNVQDRRIVFYEDGTYANSISESYVFLAAGKTSEENGECIKKQFVRLLTDLQSAIWTKPEILNK